MVEPFKKSTEAAQEVVFENPNTDEVVWLDSRLALFEEKNRWLAVSDLHYGYEVSRRTHGGLWPLWGRETIEERLNSLIDDYQPETLIINGDIVDSRAGAAQAIDWLAQIGERIPNLVLILGNHDRGGILRSFDFLNNFQIGHFVFHHGHKPLPSPKPSETIEVVGHIHPSQKITDGAGLSLKLPCLIQEESVQRWILPAFSPWAGGVNYQPAEKQNISRWMCSNTRIFKNLHL